MIVRMTSTQTAACQKRLSPTLARYWRDRAVVTDSAGKMIEFELIPDAWFRINDELLRGFQRTIDQTSRSVFAGSKRIGLELRHRYSHPALAQAATFGRQMDSLPAWRLRRGGGYVCLRPYPEQEPADFVVLGPEWESYKGTPLTRWHEIDPEPTDNPIFKRETYDEFYELVA